MQANLGFSPENVEILNFSFIGCPANIPKATLKKLSKIQVLKKHIRRWFKLDEKLHYSERKDILFNVI